MMYMCCEERRRDAIRGKRGINGIDFLEVLDPDRPHSEEAPSVHDSTPAAGHREHALSVRFVNPIARGSVARHNVRVTGGGGTQGIMVTNVEIGAKPRDHLLTVRLEGAVDTSVYTLQLVQGDQDATPPHGIDALLSSIDFSFAAGRQTEIDCRRLPVCPPEPRPLDPKIDYLSKDYASFRQLMLDRLALIIPSWTERHPADMGVALVELLAYIGDYLSYQQDVVATEAYLDTARRRVSVHRHARLVDYFMHDGSNARVWVQVAVTADNVALTAGAQLLSGTDGLATRLVPGSLALDRALAANPVVFETMDDAILVQAHNEMHFYTWTDAQCCLPRGATRATLCDDPKNRLRLIPGDVLIFEERVGPYTANPGDADPIHRQAVRLTSVDPPATLSTQDGTRHPGPLRTDPASGQAIVEIAWSTEDALTFPLCISSMTDALHGAQPISAVSMAHGNIVLADHGRTIKEALDPVPDATAAIVPALNGTLCAPPQIVLRSPPYRPQLKEQPLTQAATVTVMHRSANGRVERQVLPYDPTAPAAAVFQWTIQDVLPAISLTDGGGKAWRPQRDLLTSDAFATEFVIEVEDDGTATLRFGDDYYGMRPPGGATFTARYRIGNGTPGNVGAETLAHIVSGDERITSVRNPLPAQGGTDPESSDDVRQKAPSAFLVQERAVTPDDYARLAEQLPQVLRAVATFKWTGSWRTVCLAVEPVAGVLADSAFKAMVRQYLEQYRMAGHDLRIDGPIYVPLDVEMETWVAPGYFRDDVRSALLDVFSNRILPDGSHGVFYPDNFTFGQPVYLGTLYAAAQAVPGVAAVDFPVFKRLGDSVNHQASNGEIALGLLEVARLDNDPRFPQHGVFRLAMEGGL